MQLRDDEVLIVTRLLDEFGDLVGDDRPAADGPDDVLAGLSWPDADPVTLPTDPALRRLLPDAYPDDPDAAAEFRRYTEASLRDDMIADLSAVRLTLLDIAENGHAILDDDAAHAWLRVLNRLRLVLAVRLGIEKAEDHKTLARLDDQDPRVGPYLLYEWTGDVLSDLLRAVM
jgi:uncharacterized protein DUF2017